MSGKKGHLPIQATPGDQTFLTLPFLPSRQTVYEKHKVGLARSDPAYCKARSPFSDCRVNLPAGPTFLNIKLMLHKKLNWFLG